MTDSMPQTDPQPLAVDAKTAAKTLSISPRSLWSLTNAKEIPHARVGRRILYSLESLRRWLAKRERGGAK
ncbi:MAG: helix-turn-helix domain-containing protein [Phycisphaerae bacterium]|nr:helix-turn-helix domain-containing protein [Phycisphaerae bacterium]